MARRRTIFLPTWPRTQLNSYAGGWPRLHDEVMRDETVEALVSSPAGETFDASTSI